MSVAWMIACWNSRRFAPIITRLAIIPTLFDPKSIKSCRTTSAVALSRLKFSTVISRTPGIFRPFSKYSVNGTGFDNVDRDTFNDQLFWSFTNSTTSSGDPPR